MQRSVSWWRARLDAVAALARDHADVPDTRADLPWQKALNALLPRDVSVVAVTPAPPDFHARFSARGKTYVYTLWTESTYILPWRRAYVWDVGRFGPLDVAAMTARKKFPWRRQ